LSQDAPTGAPSKRAVTSTTNPGVKQVVKLRSARTRRETQRFIVEGYREIRRAIEGDVDIDELWICPELYLGEHESQLVEKAARRGATVIEVSKEPFEKMSYRDRPEGLLAVCRQFDTALERIQLTTTPLLLVVESIEKPGNLGTMIRTSAAAGVDGVVVTDPATDVFNPNVVRSSIGTCFLIPLAVCTTQEAITWLGDHHVTVVAATPGADETLWKAPMSDRAAIVIGSEQYGLSKEWLDAAGHRVTIPMPGGAIDSLNAAASAAVLLFEAVRQRSGG
jgi:TrmH family RNA methyltransferase